MVYSDFFKFEKAYEYELKVYKNKKKPANQIKGETPEVKTNRLLDNEQITKEVLQRDGYQCLCCGGKSKLNKEVAITFDTPGVYLYQCTPHKSMGMIAIVVVGDGDNDISKAKVKGKSKKKLKALLADL